MKLERSDSRRAFLSAESAVLALMRAPEQGTEWHTRRPNLLA
jgi:hypothetical protein